MKHIILLTLLFLSVFSSIRGYHSGGLKINVGTKFSVSASNDYELSCEGARGEVTYHVDGLPEGAKLQGGKLFISQNVKAGNYIIRIRASDESGQIAERIITLAVVHQEVEQSQGSTARVAAKGGRLDSVINSYSTVTRVERTTYENNRFPEIKFPEGASPNSINTMPTQISRKVAITSQQNRNEITADDIILKTASERHQNAVKGITNLLSIIDQARANRNYAQQSLQTYIQAYNEALAAQRQAQNDIIAAETKRTQIISAIEGVEIKIAGLQFEITDLQKNKNDLNTKRTELLTKISGEERMKAQLMSQLQKINAELAKLMKDLATYKEKGAVIQVNIAKAKADLKKAEDQLASVVERRKGAEEEVAQREEIVADLRKQLQAAEGALADSKIKLADILEEEKRIPKIIENLKKKLSGLEADFEKNKAEIARIQAEIKKLQMNDLVRQIEEIEESILADRKSIMEIDGQLAALVEPLENLKIKLKVARQDFAFLKNQIVSAEEALRTAYAAGNDANTIVAHAKQNLDAINCRYQDEEKIISEAVLNLERARAEEALARLAVEELIAHYSDALPYSVVPNGNGKTAAGVPYGNNAAGSPLGPIQQGGNGAPGEFRIRNWNNYLSLAFGQGVHPAFRGSVTKLYPFNFLSVVEGKNLWNNYGEEEKKEKKVEEKCEEAPSSARVASGTVIEVGEKSFKVRLDNGQVYNINVDTCTKMNSNKANYKMQAGDEAIVKGSSEGYSKMKASQVTCLRE